MTSAKTWMELEGIRLSEISQSEKSKPHMISLMCGILETKQTNEQKRKMRQANKKKPYS